MEFTKLTSKPEPQAASESSDHLGLEAGLKISWIRILCHTLPHKVRQLLLEHDRFEQMSSEAASFRAQLVHERGRFEAMTSETASLRAQLTQIGHERNQFEQEVHALREQLIREKSRMKGIREPRQSSSRDVPEFPKSIFESTATSKIAIIDVGAQDLVSEEHIYAPLQRAGATSIIGFEPLPDAGSPRRVDPTVSGSFQRVRRFGYVSYHAIRSGIVSLQTEYGVSVAIHGFADHV